jgi:hypothetical protein
MRNNTLAAYAAELRREAGDNGVKRDDVNLSRKRSAPTSARHEVRGVTRCVALRCVRSL